MPLSLEVVEKPNRSKSFFGPNFLGEMAPTFYGRFLARFTATAWQNLVEFRLLTSVCKTWQRSRKQNLRKVGKMQVQFEAVCGPKFMTFWNAVGDPV